MMHFPLNYSCKKIKPGKSSGLIRIITNSRCSIDQEAARLLRCITGGCTAIYGSRLESSGRRRLDLMM
jgi:hypothetical protein